MAKGQTIYVITASDDESSTPLGAYHDRGRALRVAVRYRRFLRRAQQRYQAWSDGKLEWENARYEAIMAPGLLTSGEVWELLEEEREDPDCPWNWDKAPMPVDYETVHVETLRLRA
jgi:hypothetical protein